MTFLSPPSILSASGKCVDDHLLAMAKGDSSGMKPEQGMLVGETALLGRVRAELPSVPERLSRFDSRFFRLALAAALDIEADVERLKSAYPLHRIGVILGSSTSGIHSGEEAYCAYQTSNGVYPPKYHYAQQEMGAVAEFLKAYFGLRGPAYTVSTACTSGARALLSAERLIGLGMCDAVVCGGVDSLCKLTVRGFHSLGLVSPEPCIPFSAHRRGLNLGEAASLMIMTSEPFESRRPQGALVCLAGGGESSDAHHMSAPHPEGEGAKRAIAQALTNAGLTPEKIGYVNAHGTGTQLNDSAEAKAISHCLSDNVPVSSTKPYTGHTLGAAGALEAALCVGLLQQSDKKVSLPVHCWDQTPDQDTSSLSLVSEGQEMCMVSTPGILSTSFAFGGSNAALVFCRKE